MDTTKAVTHLGLCAGYGGIELGLKRAIPNLRSVALCEIEAFAIANLVSKMEAGLMDPAPIWPDLKTFPWRAFRDRVDILTGGYPCQPFSAAGKRAGKDDPRHLWPWIAEGIGILRPRICFFENVEGHISLGLRDVIEDLGRLGYRTTWGIFSASECGAPHQRKRVFILAHRKQQGLEGLSRYVTNRDQSGWHNSQSDGPVTQSGLWRRVSFAADCEGYDEESGEPGDECSICGLNYGDDCQRPGPTQDGYEYAEFDGVLYGRAAQAWPSRPGQPQYGWEPPRVMADSDRLDGSASAEGRPHDPKAGHAGEELVQRQTQRPLGGNFNEPAGGLDYAELCVTCDNRTDELRLLGNGVVPATAERAFRVLIMELML
jgi:DNA (cytosine-5)-methyltransferase 1